MAGFMPAIHLSQLPSWPGLTRPSNFSHCRQMKMDGRVKPAHDGVFVFK